MGKIVPGGSCFRLVVVAAAAFVSGSLLSRAASKPHYPEFLRIEFLKPKPDQDYVTLERQIWRAIQVDRVAHGQIASWSVYRVLADDRQADDPYEFVVLTVSDHPLPKNVPYQANMQRALPGMDPLEIARRTGAVRQKIKIEDFRLVDAVPDSWRK